MITTTPFYHSSIRRITSIFATLFNNITIERYDSVGVLQKTLKVPLQYNTKEQFVLLTEQLNRTDNQNTDEVQKRITLPRMGFEMTSLEYDARRHGNTNRRVCSTSKTTEFNRAPYKARFSLYIATRRLDDSFRIVEQILPYFTPEFVVRIKDNDDLEHDSNIPIVLDSVNPAFEYEGNVRRAVWVLDFTVKFYMYPQVNDTSIINNATIDIRDLDTSEIIETVIKP